MFGTPTIETQLQTYRCESEVARRDGALRLKRLLAGTLLFTSAAVFVFACWAGVQRWHELSEGDGLSAPPTYTYATRVSPEMLHFNPLFESEEGLTMGDTLAALP